MNKNVVVDIDGVLADFEGAFVRAFGDERRELESLESRYPSKTRAIQEFVNDLNTYANLEPISLGLTVVDFLNDSGLDVHIITSRPADAEWVTRRWLNRLGIRYTYFGVYPSKVSRIYEIMPLCAVDDLVSKARLLKRRGVPVLLQQQPWNWYFENKSQVYSNINQFMAAFEQLILKKEKE